MDIGGNEQPAVHPQKNAMSESGDGTDNHYKYWPGMQVAVESHAGVDGDGVQLNVMHHQEQTRSTQQPRHQEKEELISEESVR